MMNLNGDIGPNMDVIPTADARLGSFHGLPSRKSQAFVHLIDLAMEPALIRQPESFTYLAYSSG